MSVGVKTGTDQEDPRIVQVLDNCIDCGICQKSCAFLSTYGSPLSIAREIGVKDRGIAKISFECSLCGLCRAVCPKDVDPAAMLYAIRTRAIESGEMDISKFKPLLRYEKIGISKPFSLYSFPKDCDTVFFPGCTFSGTRPGKTLQLYRYLQNHFPTIGVVLDCCTKISHDFGRTSFFNDRFSEMRDYLLKHGIKRVLVACPNCFQVFNTYGKTLSVSSVYEILAETLPPSPIQFHGDEVTVHDPCVIRSEPGIQQAVRQLIENYGLKIHEMPHTREKTLCCGEGGGVWCVNASFPSQWKTLRKEEADGRKVITCCAGCVNSLKNEMPAYHVIDLFFDPKRTLAGNPKVSGAPVTYINRLTLKKKLRNACPGKIVSVREKKEKEKIP